jgi:hypothetical protein
MYQKSDTAKHFDKLSRFIFFICHNDIWLRKELKNLQKESSGIELDYYKYK